MLIIPFENFTEENSKNRHLYFTILRETEIKLETHIYFKTNLIEYQLSEI